MEITIRHSREEDISSIAAIYAYSVIHDTASWEYAAPSVKEMAARRSEILAKNFPYFVASLEGEIVGYAYASSYRARIGYRFIVEDSVYVKQGCEGRGIGRKLLMALIEECTQRGYRQMIAVIGDSANTASIKLHKRCGFEHATTLQGIGFKFGRWLDSVQMLRPLGAGASTLPDRVEQFG